MFKLIKFVCFLVLAFQGQAQKVFIQEIVLEGNKKTTSKAILRELDFTQGDSLELKKLKVIFEKNKNQLRSTGLFNTVSINLRNYKPDNESAIVEINFEENWYLYPVPIFELADRNFNVWWTEQGRSLSRIDYGIRLSHYNFSGNRDPLKIKAQFGFTRKFEIKYAQPNLSADNKWGFASTVFYSDNKTIGYKTIANKTQWHKNEQEDILLKRFRIGPELKFRPSVNTFHALRLEYHHNQIDDYVVENLNEDYFSNGATSLKMFFIEYDFQWDRRHFTLYPSRGHMLFANAKKEGLGVFDDVNNFNLSIGGEYYLPLTESLVFGMRVKAKTNLNRNPVAFANNTGLGWDEDIVSGYELYVLDGPDFVFNSNRLSYKLFERNVKTSKIVPRQFQKMNLAIYLRLNFDSAIVNETRFIDTNDLNNQWIFGYGPAVDFILFNNFLISFEYSFNDIGEQGLFFSNKIAF